MEKEFKNALEELSEEIIQVSNKYQMMSEDMLKIGLAINKVAMLAPTGTFEGEK